MSEQDDNNKNNYYVNDNNPDYNDNDTNDNNDNNDTNGNNDTNDTNDNYIFKVCYLCDYPKRVRADYEQHINENGVYYGYTAYLYKQPDLWICLLCSRGCLRNVDFTIQENGECCVCFETSILLQLPTCSHKMCIQCCKTIYYGSSTVTPPSESHNDITHPDWPYEFHCSDEDLYKGTRKDWMIVDDKEFEYGGFFNDYFDYQNNSYEELIAIRDSLIDERPDWMNTEVFIHYENALLHYCIEQERIQQLWEDFNETKIMGNRLCPICRAYPL